LFTSIDISGTWNVNRPTTKTSTQDTFSALPCSKKNLAKKWSKDPIFLVTSFLSILSMFSEFSTGHGFHLFKLIFFVVTSLVLLSEEKISEKIKRKSQRIPKKQRHPKNGEERGAKVDQYLEEHIESAI